MAWTRIGLVFVADGQFGWMKSHASNPVALAIGDGLHRIFFSTRDSQNMSHIGFVDINVEKPLEILRVSESPVLSPGARGLFDDSGVIPACLVRLPAGLGLFYIGISRGISVPFFSFAGLAILSEENDTATRVRSTPILDRSSESPFCGGSVFVVHDNENDIYRAWLEASEGWEYDKNGLQMRLGIKFASSLDGLDWSRENSFCIPPTDDISYLGSPCVLKEGGVYRMWFSYKTPGGYRIGYAESTDGVFWKIAPEGAGITVSASGWDDEEIEYPHVFRHKDKLFMLYNGNNYGKTGFGLAVWEE